MTLRTLQPFDQCLVEPLKSQSLIEVATIGSFREVAVAAEIGVIDLVSDHENCGHQAQQKLSLGFVKWPAESSRPVRISLRLSIGASFFFNRTLHDG